MAPIAKENDTLTATPESAARPSASAPVPSDNAAKQQPVALEVPVSVNGARAVEGSAKREPFSEATKTVLIFGSGAVIRLASTVAPGQLLFLTNEKTKKEVVCQVVKSKNYRNISGYVELEFTESVVGFWGMRFPSDRIGMASQSSMTPSPAVDSSVATGAPVAPRPVAPVVVHPPANAAPKIFESKPATPAFVAPLAPVIEIPAAPKPEPPVSHVPATPASLLPELPVNAVPVKPVGPVSSTFDLPRTPEAHASIFAPSAQTSAAPPVVDVKSLSDEPERSFVEPPPPATLAPLAAADPQTEALKQQTARLQEQLSSLLFAEKTAEKHASAPPPPPAPAADNKPYDPFAEILQFAAKTEPAPALVKRAEPAKIVPPPVTSLLDDQELKIPSWLEPLARNAAAPSSTQEPIEREKAKHLAEQSSFEEIAPETTANLEKGPAPELQAPNFGSDLNFELAEPSVENSPRKSGNGLMFAAIAAGALLLAGGGVWYFRQQSGDVHAGVTAESRPSPVVSGPAENLPTQNSSVIPANSPAQSVQSTSSADNNAPLQTNSNKNAPKVESAAVSLSPVSGKQVISNSAGGGNVTTLAASEPVAAQPKKPSLGEVRLATPKVAKRGSSANDSESDAGLAFSGDQQDSNAVALGAGLAANTSQPAAPAAALPVGGDVKQARLISSVPPSYPVLAKNQHVAGDVRIDALIDSSGRVTTMKVVSGPTLLYQAAMDALRQWKYQPATLNGNTVPMHLTVTIQFRLQ